MQGQAHRSQDASASPKSSSQRTTGRSEQPDSGHYGGGAQPRHRLLAVAQLKHAHVRAGILSVVLAVIVGGILPAGHHMSTTPTRTVWVWPRML